MIGFLTADLVAGWVWPGSAHGRKYAERILASLVEKKALLRRPLGGRSGAFVLTKIGAAEVEARDGLRWGRTVVDVVGDKHWKPPTTFDHDLRAAWFGVWARSKGWQPVFEREAGQRRLKVEVPDCLLVSPQKGTGHWVEVENSQKNVEERHDQITDALRRMLKPMERQTPWGTVSVQRTIFVLPPAGYKDRRGYAINQEPLLRREWSTLAKKIEELQILEDRIEWSRSAEETETLRATADKLRKVLTAEVYRETEDGFEKLKPLTLLDD